MRIRWAERRARLGIPDKKACEWCERIYARAELTGGVSDTYWLGRRFCSMACRTAAMRAGRVFPTGEDHPGWKGDAVKHPHARTRQLLRGQAPDYCERCGFMLVDEIHHKDRKPLNNERDNIEFLCATCHDFEHAVAA